MVFIICEAGVNHQGRLDYALQLVAEAKKSGADAVKFQGFAPSEQAPLDYKTRAMLKGLWMSPEELIMLSAECRHKQIEFMLTPMNDGWLKHAVTLGVKRIKVGSGQNRNIPLLKAVGATKLPVIISNGMADNREFCVAVETLIDGGAEDITMLSCVSKYPTPETDITMNEMARLKDLFPGLKVGLSSHCRSFWPCVAAAYAGATVIEAHMKLSEGDIGPDMSSSLLPEEFKAMVREVRCATR